jgi:uncharacterized membrane protein YecN with MAPEG domain
MPLTFTPLYVALAAIILLVLTARVIGLRRRLAIGLGTGGDAELEKAVRGHGNFTEYAPIGLIVLASAELSGAGSAWVNTIGILLIGGRLLHAWGLSRSRGYSVGRSTGIILTVTALVAGIGVNLGRFLGH